MEPSMGDEITEKDVLFVGKSKTAICWYRIALPAMYLGMDWVGAVGGIGQTGAQRSDKPFPQSAEDYRIIIWQQPNSPDEYKLIRHLRDKGIKVVLDVDDYLHGVRRMKDHDFRHSPAFTPKAMAKWERTMALSDGLIVSTDFIAKKYSKFNENIWVCKNGLDLGRYDLTKPKHDKINIGWAGATGHTHAFKTMEQSLDQVLNEYDNTCVISVGQPFAAQWAHLPPGNRHMALPFQHIEHYPNVMSLFDIALAPARDSGWYRAKSALRYYEAAAMGIPTIGSPLVYSEIEDGVTGLLAHTREEWYDALTTLVEDDDLRIAMGKNAKKKAYAEFDMFSRRHQWVKAIESIALDL